MLQLLVFPEKIILKFALWDLGERRKGRKEGGREGGKKIKEKENHCVLVRVLQSSLYFKGFAYMAVGTTSLNSVEQASRLETGHEPVLQP